MATEPTTDGLRRGLKRWLLLDGNRLVIAGLILLVTFLFLISLGLVGLIDVRDQDAVRGVATGFVPGLIAFLSIVLGINQLVLSQEFGSAGEVRERIRNVRDYRHDVEAMAGVSPSPVLPVGFLTFVVQTIKGEAVALDESIDSEVDPAVREPVAAYAKAVVDESNRAHESLDQLHSGRINALLPVLEYNDSYQLYEARRLRHDYEDRLPAATRQSLSRLIEALELFSVARTQFRTTYTQRVLARLSRQLLYVGVPALIVVIALGLMPAESALLGSGLRGLVVVSALFSVAISPLAVLSTYLLRVATVSERTVSAGPFASRPGTVRGDQRQELDARSIGRDGSSADAAEERSPGQ